MLGVEHKAVQALPEKIDVKKPARMPAYFMAGAEGFEPPVPGPKPGALPLGDAPTKFFSYYRTSNHPIQE